MHAVTELLGDETGREFEPRDFRDKMLAFCKKHHREKRALVFAFLIYDFDDPQMVKVLEDRVYWAALDHISGTAITVFACNSPTVDSHDALAMQIRDNIGLVFAEIFGVNIQLQSPSILFFQVDDERVIDSVLATLDEKKIEDSFNEMRELFKGAAEALKNVRDENRANVREIFHLVENELSQRQLIRTVKKGVATIKPLQAILNSIGGIFTK